ncbi:MAG TPA: histidine phosphatase family protein [Longimicrobiaceae bacterium]|nr:histidine phosphatase family protein [Longimicrobiaceae bacterium]
MKLLVVRHAIAEDRDEFAYTGRPDAERPLTKQGRERMRRAVAGLVHLAPRIDVLATSPLVRAVQTADLVAEEYGGLQPVTVDELAPEHAPEAMLPWLRTHEGDAVVAVIGHEPHLSFLVGWLLTGRHESFVELKKGAATLLDFDDPPAAGNATLLWALAPGHLRRIRKE